MAIINIKQAIGVKEQIFVVGRLAQLVRALVSHTRGHKFESCTAHHIYSKDEQKPR